jgi:hypothetical protein
MELIKPDFIVGMLIVVGACEAIKRKGLRVPTGWASLALSILAGLLLAEPFGFRSVAAYSLVVYGASTMAYETLIKRLKPPQKTPEGKQ